MNKLPLNGAIPEKKQGASQLNFLPVSIEKKQKQKHLLP